MAFTARHTAALNGDQEFFRLLLEHGADMSLTQLRGSDRPAWHGAKQFAFLPAQEAGSLS